MRAARRQFVDGLLLLIEEEQAPDGLSAEGRAFVEGVLAILAQPAPPAPPPPDLSADQRAFVDTFLGLLKKLHHDEAPDVRFERLIMARWELLTWRVHGALASRFAELDDEGHRVLRCLEDAPALLGPLALSEDELAHSRLLGWALRLPGELGDAVRGAWLKKLGVRAPVRGWRVVNESTLGQGCRVDLEIEIPGRWLCLVEMKVGSNERDGQLPDYRGHLDAACEAAEIDGNLVFLTVKGDESVEEVDHDTLSFRDLLTMWLPLVQLVRGLDAHAAYLASWLVSIARDLCDAAGEGPSARWDFSTRMEALSLLEALGAEDD